MPPEFVQTLEFLLHGLHGIFLFAFLAKIKVVFFPGMTAENGKFLVRLHLFIGVESLVRRSFVDFSRFDEEISHLVALFDFVKLLHLI